MQNIQRLGLGCMGMKRANKESSIQTVRYALDSGITLFNTGEFYNQGESELVLGEALTGVPRDKFFVSVKFGMLPKPEGGLYGIDMNPKNIKAHLVYSLRRLNLDYVDLFQPARLDESIAVEDVVGEISRLVEQGYVRHVGLSMVEPKDLLKAALVSDIHTVEMEYSLLNRAIENEMISCAQKTHSAILTFGALCHGNLCKESFPKAFLDLEEVAKKYDTTVQNLALAWCVSKYDGLSILIGTTSPSHLKDAVNAVSLKLSESDINLIESAFCNQGSKIPGRNMRFVNGEIIWG